MNKPAKPHPDFPLFPHASGQWAKKVKGKLYYFGKWDRPREALNQWLSVKDELLAGRTPVAWDPEALTIADCLNLALTAKHKRVQSGELDQRTFDDYKAAAREVLQVIHRDQVAKQLRPYDFQALRDKLGAGRSVVTLRNLVRRVRVLLNWCSKNGYLGSTSQLWGEEFAVPSARVLRLDRNEKGDRFLGAQRIVDLIGASKGSLRPMIWLGLNCAYGPKDVCLIRWSDIVDGWACLPRNKTGKGRRAKLWPETIETLGEPGDGLIFRTRHGNPWTPSAIGHEFQKLRKEGEVFGFYWLRHTFLTVAEGTKDFEACRAVMGHIDPSVTGQYREGVSDQRLQSVTDFVRDWLYAD